MHAMMAKIEFANLLMGLRCLPVIQIAPTARIVAVTPKTRVSISLLATKLWSAGWKFGPMPIYTYTLELILSFSVDSICKFEF
jgi:hypothetical protein